MKKLEFILCIFVVFVVMGSIRFLDDNDFTSDGFAIHTNVNNRKGVSEIENVKMKYLFLDDGIDIAGSSSTTDLRGGDIGAKTVYYDIYNNEIPAGEYMVKIYVYGDNGVRRIKHRPIIIQ